MEVTITWQSLLTAGAVISAVVLIFKYLGNVFGWFNKQKMQDKNIQDIQEEQTILTAGILACLKGLVELGCDGVVKEQINKIETHLNNKAHKQ